jgi:hypothetical protein
MSRLSLLLAAACAVGACGSGDPNVSTCGDDCPDVSAGGRDGSTDDERDAGRGDAGPRQEPDTTGAGSGGRGGRAGRGGAGEDTAGASGSAAEGGAEAGEGGSDATPACGDCPLTQPHCSPDATCVECLQDAHCAPNVCADGACVACKQNSDCTDPASSRCVQNACMPCAASADCAHIAGLTVCDQSQCVQCTGADYAPCGVAPGGDPYICDALGRTCSTMNTRHSAGTCNPCVSDAQCEPGQLCVMQYFDEVGDAPDQGEVEVAYVCLWRQDATEPGAPMGDCANTRPYVAPRAGSRSIEGTQAAVCGLRATTCAGYKDYSIKPCSGLADDASCGDPRFTSDAHCEMVAASTYECTTPCGSDTDCDVGFACVGTQHCAVQ